MQTSAIRSVKAQHPLRCFGIRETLNRHFDAPYLVLFPALAVMLCVLCFNFLGDALRDYLDPRTRLSIGL